MKLFKNIREFFWPLLEEAENPFHELLNENDITVSSEHLQKTLDYALNNYNEESERKTSVENKASMFIGTISIVTSIVIAATSIIVKDEGFIVTTLILIILLSILTIYMSRTIWFAIKTLERRNYYSISINDFLIKDIDDNYYRKIISEITNKINRNSSIINQKVDNMTMAQEYFKRAIVTIALYSLVVLLFFILKSGIDLMFFCESMAKILNQIEISGWNTFVLYVISIFSLIVSVIALRRKK